jgi:hypothetical protein
MGADGRGRTPGIGRAVRLSDEGLERLRRQLETGARPSRPVLEQWVRRYGEPARELLMAHGIDIEPAP